MCIETKFMHSKNPTSTRISVRETTIKLKPPGTLSQNTYKSLSIFAHTKNAFLIAEWKRRKRYKYCHLKHSTPEYANTTGPLQQKNCIATIRASQRNIKNVNIPFGLSSVLKIDKNDDFLMASFLDDVQKWCSGEGTATVSKNHEWRIEFNYFYKPVWAAWKCVCAKRQETIWFGAHATFEKITSRTSLPKSCCGSEKSRDQFYTRRIPLDQWSILAFEVPVRRVNGKQRQLPKKGKMLFSHWFSV